MPGQYRKEINRTLNKMREDNPGTFTTKDFIGRFQTEEAAAWKAIVSKYGLGGRGARRHFTSFSLISQHLQQCGKRRELYQLEFIAAPADWGSRAIALWSFDEDGGVYISPEERTDKEDIWEGAVTRVIVNRYERRPEARRKCIEHYGATCVACGIDFYEKYGDRGSGFIHVHHLVPLHTIEEAYQVDPIKDLRPVCPNCHAMIHVGGDMLSIAKLKRIIRRTETVLR